MHGPAIRENDMRTLLGLAGVGLLLAGCDVTTTTTTADSKDQAPVERGKYLVTVGACTDCHTPGSFLGMPDTIRFLGGSEVGFEIPGLGVFYPPNLTSDRETGLGNWTEAQIVAALTTGVRPDGRQLAPAMPWMHYANFTPEDSMSIAAYLKTLPPVVNKVPGPFGPNETPTSFVMRVVPPPGAAPGGAPAAPAKK
jgi:mono/diheme cytochrome c family protein